MNAVVMGKEDADPYYGAPTIILVLGDKSKVTPVEDASLALGNMYNAAYSLGLGSCVLGYPDCEKPKAAPRKDNFVVMVK